MAQAAGLSFTLDPRFLDVGAAEERATFGRLQVRANDCCLTEGVAPHESNELLLGPYVSGYHLAEWLMWNWWRLLWESPPRGGPSREWAFSHCLSSIGEGYVWPNVVISSDGCRAVTIASRTSDAAPGLYRYVGAPDWQIVSTEQLRTGMRRLVRSVLQRLDNVRLADTNLHRLWRDVELASENAETARLRRVEARLGLDPNEVDEAIIQASCAAAESLGANALEELAADPAGDSPTTLPTTANRPVRSAFTAKLAKADGTRRGVLQLLHAADLGLTDVKVVKPDADTLESLKRVMHTLRDDEPGDVDVVLDAADMVQLVHGDGDGVAFDSADESMGTQVWVGLVGPVLHALEHGHLLLVDEIDASLHPLLVKRLIELFQNPDTNPRCAQLVFNAHDTTQLDGKQPLALGRDQIWFAERDDGGASHLVPLADFKARRDESVRRRYLRMQDKIKSLFDDFSAR